MAEVDSEVSCKDGVLNHPQGLGVLGRCEGVQNPVAVQVEDYERLVEVMPLKGGAGVELGQGGVGGQEVTVVCS